MQAIPTTATKLSGHERYAQIRATIGTQAEVAKQLGVARTALWRRERGESRITAEMWIAINALADDVKQKAESDASRKQFEEIFKA